MPWRLLAPLLAIPTPVIFVAAAAIAAALLWKQGSLAEIGGTLRSSNPWAVVLLLLAYALSIFGLGLRWHTLVRMVGGAPPWTTSVEVFLTSVIVNYAAPIGLAVPTRAALTVRDLRLSPGQSAAVVGWEAGLDIFALSAISAVWLGSGGRAAIISSGVDRQLVVAAVVTAVAATIVGALALRSRYGQRVRGYVGRGASFARGEPRFAWLAVFLTAGFWVLQTAVMAGLLAGLGVRPTLALLLGIMGLPILIGMLSPVPGGAGVREGLMAAAARVEGVAAGPVLLAAIAYRLALFVVTPLVWGMVRAWRTIGARR